MHFNIFCQVYILIYSFISSNTIFAYFVLLSLLMIFLKSYLSKIKHPCQEPIELIELVEFLELRVPHSFTSHFFTLSFYHNEL